ncbi:hypothetical protein GCM10010531_32760 [Blastococcus jejuensis]|uniref:Uncharacterized protein n=2 Tax=Blastococcus jejuensis TaxID=351224 RepID=A0ABP6PEB1_9ACTN
MDRKSRASGFPVPTGTVPVMTTTLPAPGRFSTPAPTRPALPPVPPAAPAVCPVERWALRSAAHDLAAALTGVAFDEPCRPERQRALLVFSAGVLRGVRGLAEAPGLPAACDAVEAATPLFASDISAGAPRLAGAWTLVADLLAGAAGEPHEHEDLAQCERRFRAAAGTAGFVVPWFLDACSPRERVELVRTAPRRVRLALRLAEDGWLALRDAVRGV